LKRIINAQEQVEKDRKRLADLEWELDLRRHKKCNQIAKIFPVSQRALDRSHTPESGYRIGVIWIPENVASLLRRMIDNNETQNYISTALGFIVKLVSLLSKYLNVPLLHNMRFVGSNSEIEDNIHDYQTAKRGKFKLSHGPNSEDLRLQRAVQLLMENILQLCHHRGVRMVFPLQRQKQLNSLKPLFRLLEKEAMV